MNSITKGIKWFGHSRIVTVGITAIGGVLLASGCSPVDDPENSATNPGSSETPSVTAGPSGQPTETSTPTISQDVYQQETADYTEWDGVSPLTPGVYVSDPDGEKTAKPDELLGHSAYFRDGAWYVFDPSSSFPQYVEDYYFISKEGDTAITSDKNNDAVNKDLEVCQISINRNGNGEYYAVGLIPVTSGGPGGDGRADFVVKFTADGVFQTYSTPEAAVEGTRAKMIANKPVCKNNSSNYVVSWGDTT